MGFQTIKASQGTSSVQSGVSYEENVKSQNAIPAVPAVSGRIEETVISVGNQHRYGQLFIDNLKARKTVFIDQKSWDLPHTEGMEFDQYDTPQSRSVVIHEYGRVLAGVRLLPTTARCGCYSYMLRDAQLGV